MRTFSADVSTLLEGDSIKFFYLIKLEFNSNYYLTSYGHDIVYDGNAYTANSGIFEIETPEFSRVVDREAFRIAAVDLQGTLFNEIKNNVIGKRIEVRAGFIGTDGQPMLDADDTILIYKGYVDTPSVQNDWESKLVTFEGSSPMADLDQINNFVTSRDNMKQRDALDTSFDSIYDNSEIQIKWGKIK